MARNKAIEERVKALVAEVLADEEAQGLNGEHENINDIEDGMVRIGDMVAREFGLQKLATHMQRPSKVPLCPDCGHAGEPQGERTRKVITRRGEVPLTEAKYRCPKCRRLFFPSDRLVGTGSPIRLLAAHVSPDRVCRGAGGQFSAAPRKRWMSSAS